MLRAAFSFLIISIIFSNKHHFLLKCWQLLLTHVVLCMYCFFSNNRNRSFFIAVMFWQFQLVVSLTVHFILLVSNFCVSRVYINFT
jgi:hypothetical protein